MVIPRFLGQEPFAMKGTVQPSHSRTPIGIQFIHGSHFEVLFTSEKGEEDSFLLKKKLEFWKTISLLDLAIILPTFATSRLTYCKAL